MPEIRNDNNEILRRFGDAYSYVTDRKKRDASTINVAVYVRLLKFSKKNADGNY